MKRISALLFSVLLWTGCSTSDSDMPTLELTGAYLEGDEINYVYSLDRLPPLALGDCIDLTFHLDGNGNYLKTFVIKNEGSSLTTAMTYISEDVSEQLSEEFEGVFFNDILQTEVGVKAKVVKLKEEKPVLSFFLSTKTAKAKGATLTLELDLGDE